MKICPNCSRMFSDGCTNCEECDTALINGPIVMHPKPIDAGNADVPKPYTFPHAKAKALTDRLNALGMEATARRQKEN